MPSGELKRAESLYLQGRFDEAKAAFLEVAQRDPTNAAALERLGTIALWENQCDEAKERFGKAWRHRAWHRRHWPFDSQIKYRQALMHYRQDQFASAAMCFRSAAGPLAIGPFRDLKALAAQTALLSGEEAYAVEGPAQTRIAFLATDPLPVIELSVNGFGPLNVLIDTGGAELILDDEVARQVGAQLSGSIRSDYAGRKTARTGVGMIEIVTLGEIAVRRVPIHTLDTKAMSKSFGRPIHGILGTRLLMHFLSTIDYVGAELILRRTTSTASPKLAGRGSGCAIPFWLLDMHCMVAWGSINDLPPTLFFVDTGLAGAGFTASQAALSQANISIDWKAATSGIGGAGEVRQVAFLVDRLALGVGADAVVDTNVPGVAIEGGVSILHGALGVHVGGLISHQFFRKRALTLDFNAMRLIVQ